MSFVTCFKLGLLYQVLNEYNPKFILCACKKIFRTLVLIRYNIFARVLHIRVNRNKSFIPLLFDDFGLSV